MISAWLCRFKLITCKADSEDLNLFRYLNWRVLI